jgi:2-polyprenyl-3-methyl-5-hydroxy-6-metoxy-1,4-benzoquinol methylase
MSTTNQWETFFDNHASHYMQNAFTRNTLAEVDFLLNVLQPATGGDILDMGCGTGRHAIELAKRGYLVTGVDISRGMLAAADRAAREAGVEVEWIQADASRFSSRPACMMPQFACVRARSGCWVRTMTRCSMIETSCKISTMPSNPAHRSC